MYKLAFLCALVAAAVAQEDDVEVSPEGKGRNPYSKNGPAMKYKPLKEVGPCEQTMECARNDFSRPDKAPCLGYYSCFKADFVTKNDIKCLGSLACNKATFYGNSKKVICSGYRACQAAKGSEDSGPDLMAKIKVACNGPFSCNTLPGGIYAKDVVCDGDAACSNVNPIAMKPYIAAKKAAADAGTIFDEDVPVSMLKIEATRDLSCNGKSVCRYTRLIAQKKAYCDGDGACRESFISAKRLRCHGKRACQAASPVFTQELEAYGFMAAANTKIIPLSTKKALNIYAYGFNSMKNAEIVSSKGQIKLYAYGWRAAYGSKVYCSGADCIIECWVNACKSMVIYYKDADEDVTITPEGCHPSQNPDNDKKKVAGVLCPTFEKASNRLDLEMYADGKVELPPYPESLRAEIEESNKEDAEFNAAEDKATNEYFTTLITELENDLEQKLGEASNRPEIESIAFSASLQVKFKPETETESLFNEGMAIQSLQQSTVSSSLIISNAANAVITMLALFAVLRYYSQCNASKKSEISPLLP